MHKGWVAAAAFVIGAALGMGLLAFGIAISAMLFVKYAGTQGPLAGMVHHWTVLVIPVACGALASWWALRKLNAPRA
jgi:hypothetical protein